ncbi:MAG TPA: hypothetical protein VEG44_04135 [Candidatus Acidoferrales bacterium]|nr:hypothetical protein [Candidatus Acidoferrales bacterium]
MTIKERAAGALYYFDHVERETTDNKVVLVLKDDAPQQLRHMLHGAHLGLVPNDTSVRMIYELLCALSDARDDSEVDGIIAEFESPIYYHELIDWLGSDMTRVDYADDAIERLRAIDSEFNLLDVLRLAYKLEVEEIAAVIVNELKDDDKKDKHIKRPHVR